MGYIDKSHQFLEGNQQIVIARGFKQFSCVRLVLEGRGGGVVGVCKHTRGRRVRRNDRTIYEVSQARLSARQSECVNYDKAHRRSMYLMKLFRRPLSSNDANLSRFTAILRSLALLYRKYNYSTYKCPLVNYWLLLYLYIYIYIYARDNETKRNRERESKRFVK